MKNPFPWRSPLWQERDEEIRRFTRLATWEELDLTEPELQLYSNGVKPKGRSAMDKIATITTTINNMFEIRINTVLDEHGEPLQGVDNNQTFEVFLLRPKSIRFIPAPAAAALESEIAQLEGLGYMQS